jgi:hypothetical protein
LDAECAIGRLLTEHDVPGTDEDDIEVVGAAHMEHPV